MRAVRHRVGGDRRDRAFATLDAHASDGLSPRSIRVIRRLRRRAGAGGGTLVVARPPDAPLPDRPDRLAAAVGRRADQRVAVTVGSVDRERSRPDASSA